MTLRTVIPALCALAVFGFGAATALVSGEAASATASAAELSRAATLVAEGDRALIASNADPSKSVDAALAYAQALPIYEAAGDQELVRQLQANLFWCRKRMNQQDLDRYVAARSGNAAIASAAERMEAVVSRQVPAGEAGKWLQEVDLYVLEHPDQPFKIAIRYFEVAERFAGTPQSLTAQRKALDYQAKAGAAAQQAHRETLFSRPSVPPAGRQAIPEEQLVKDKTASLKKLYKEEYADRSEPGRRALAATLIELAEATRDDLGMRYAMLDQALDISVATKDVQAILTATDLIGNTFVVDTVPLKKEQLARLRSAPLAVAVSTLLEDPAHAGSNTVAGRYFALELRSWDIGLPMLSLGDDATYSRLAEMELAKPQGGAQEFEMAEGWYAIGGPKNPETVACWSRAMHWYEIAARQLTGATKVQAEKRMDDMFGVVFPAQVDWKNLTPAQWDKLKAPTVAVVANKVKIESPVTLKAGEKARVVPHPTDTWTFSGYLGNGQSDYTWKGGEALPADGAFGRRFAMAVTQNPFPLGCMVMWVEEGKKQELGIIEGPGRVTLASSDPPRGAKGQIRAKILVLEP